MSTSREIDLTRLLPVGRHGWLIRTPGYTAGEVRRLLREGSRSPRGRAVSRCVARASDWVPPVPDVTRCPLFYRDQLPRIIFWYAQGESVEEIARRLSAFGTPWGVKRTLDVACRRIAACLNEHPDEYGARP